MTTRGIREVLNINETEFSQKFSIPLDIVREWDIHGTMPRYVYEMVLQIIKQHEAIQSLTRSVALLTGMER